MNAERLKNILALGGKISKRVQKALGDLREELERGARSNPLNGHSSSPAPIPIPIPVSHGAGKFGNKFSGIPLNFSRKYTSWNGFYNCHSNGFFMFDNKQRFKFKLLRFFKHYHTRHCRPRGKCSFKIGFSFSGYLQNSKLGINNSLYSRRALYSTLTGLPDPLLESYNDKPLMERKGTKNVNVNVLRHLVFPRLPTAESDFIDTKQSHTQFNVTREVQQGVSGCYIDFPIAVNVTIPSDATFSAQTLDDVLNDLTYLLKRIEEIKLDLTNLFELGELPIEFISKENIIRVRFPNCDKEKLEVLCKDKNIQGGRIYEGFTAEETDSYDVCLLSSMLYSDLLSSMAKSGSSCSASTLPTDVLSEYSVPALENCDIVRIPSPSFQRVDNVMFDDYDESYWTTA